MGSTCPSCGGSDNISAFARGEGGITVVGVEGVRLRAWPPPEESAALLDPPIVPWLERLNAIPGIETLQSCSGDHPGAETSAHVWIAGRLPHSLCLEIGRLDGVEDLSILYEREAFPVTEVRFSDWLTGFRNLTEYLEGWGGSG